jgi:predicted Rossmann fold nucleotide-binding protein DprA/Smf involved in DNA uptake
VNWPASRPTGHRLADAVLAWQGQGSDRHVFSVGDACYPRALLESPDPPLLLYATGDVALRCHGPLPRRGGQPPAHGAGS